MYSIKYKSIYTHIFIRQDEASRREKAARYDPYARLAVSVVHPSVPDIALYRFKTSPFYKIIEKIGSTVIIG